MNTSPQELIDRVSSNTGLHLPALAQRLGIKERSLRRIRSEENVLSEAVRLHLLDLEKLYSVEVPKSGNHAVKEKATRVNEDTPEYGRRDEEALMLVLARVTARHTVNDLATLISEFASDENLPPNLRTRVVKILSGFIPERMK